MGKRHKGGGGKKPKRHRHNNPQPSGAIHSAQSQTSLSRFFNLTTKDKGPASYLVCALVLVFLFSAFFIFLDPIRRQFGLSSRNDIDPASYRYHRSRLQRLYEKYNPSKLDEIDSILEKWRGKEKQLFKTLHNKYVKPNKAKKEKEKKQKQKDRESKRYDKEGNEIPDYNNETPEQASARRRREKERDRRKRKKSREGYYDDWDEDELSGTHGFDDDTILRFDVCYFMFCLYFTLFSFVL